MQYIYHSALSPFPDNCNMDDLDFGPGYDSQEKDDYPHSPLSQSSSTTSLYQLEQRCLQGIPSMTTVHTTTTVTTTTTTISDSITSSPISSPAIKALSIVDDHTIGDLFSLEEQSKEEALAPTLNLVSDGLYLFVFGVPVSLYYPIRALILFFLGFMFSVLIDHIQTQHNLVKYSNNIPKIWDTATWLPPTCGFSAVIIGTFYPIMDHIRWKSRINTDTHDLSDVIRCFGGFIGVIYAASKLLWTSSLQTSFTLALISIGLWFWFDRTLHGFMISFAVAFSGTIVSSILVLLGWYSFASEDILLVGSWLPCILYSSSVCFGSIGRQLNAIPQSWFLTKDSCNDDNDNTQ